MKNEEKKNTQVASTVTEEVAAPAIKKTKPDPKKDIKGWIKWMRDEESQKVKGVFRYIELKGGVLSFNYCAYEGDPLEILTFRDGESYEVKLGVARHLNRSGKVPIHERLMDENNKAVTRVKTFNSRYAFYPLGFSDEDFGEKHIIDVHRY